MVPSPQLIAVGPLYVPPALLAKVGFPDAAFGSLTYAPAALIFQMAQPAMTDPTREIKIRKWM